jgi:hypothetical protein
MSAICVSLAEELQLDFSRAVEQLVLARSQQAAKDTPIHRTAIAEWLAIIDQVLDLYLETMQPGL